MKYFDHNQQNKMIKNKFVGPLPRDVGEKNRANRSDGTWLKKHLLNVV